MTSNRIEKAPTEKGVLDTFKVYDKCEKTCLKKVNSTEFNKKRSSLGNTFSIKLDLKGSRFEGYLQ